MVYCYISTFDGACHAKTIFHESGAIQFAEVEHELFGGVSVQGVCYVWGAEQRFPYVDNYFVKG